MNSYYKILTDEQLEMECKKQKQISSIIMALIENYFRENSEEYNELIQKISKGHEFVIFSKLFNKELENEVAKRRINFYVS
jgi:hypothetical protein